MTRITWLASALGLAVSLVGCHTLTKTQGVCDCNAPPVESLLTEPTLPPHLCPHPHYNGVSAPLPTKKATEPSVAPAPEAVAPKMVTPKKSEK